MNEGLQLLDLTQVAITAMVDPSGHLGAIKGLWPKLFAAANEAATIGLVRTVIVAADQPDVPPELELVTASPLRIIRAATLQEAITHLHEEHGPQHAMRRHERQQCATLDVLGRPVALSNHYQILPLLREVKRDRLPRMRKDVKEEADGAGAPHHVDILRWEEELQGEHITYESIELESLFADFPSIVKTAKHLAPRFVVLGPPGSGKTTLTQYLGWQATNGDLRVGGRRMLPTRVRLRDWETFALTRTGADQQLAAYLTQQYAHLDPAPTLPNWRRWLQNGEVLLLLDGIDEIQGGPAFLGLVATTLAAFSACPTVLTCRTVSFERHRMLCPDFPVFTLAGLGAAQRDAYIRTFPAEHPTDYEPSALIDRLRRTSQLQPLAANPLLLSIICYVTDSTAAAQFPTTRGKLYAMAIEQLLSSQAQRVATSYPGVFPAPHEKLAILQRTALRLFLQSDRQLTFSGQALGQALKEALSEEGYGDASAPWANALQADLLHNSGLLRGDTEHGFFFFHLTIQEFLTAAALARQINEEGWAAPLTCSGKHLSVSQLIDKKSWDPRWQEVLILLLGQLMDPFPLLTLLTEQRKDDVFRHRLALAAQGLAEVRAEVRDALSHVVDSVTERVFSIWLSRETRGAGAVVSHLTRALPALEQVNGRIEKTPLLRWLRLRLHDVNPDVRAGIIEACAHMGERLASETDLLAALTVSLGDPDVFVRVRTTEALRRIGSATLRHPDVLTALLQAGEHDPERFVRLSAKRTLEQCKEGLTPVPEALSAFLTRQSRRLQTAETDEQDRPQSFASPPAATEAEPVSVAALYDPDPEKRARAMIQLKQLGATELQSQEALPALVEIVLHDPDGGIRVRAADVLGQRGDFLQHHPHVALVLITALRDRDAGVRAHAAEACGRLDLPTAHRQEVLAALSEALDDTDSEVRSTAAEALDHQMAKGMRLFKRWWGKKETRTVEELTKL